MSKESQAVTFVSRSGNYSFLLKPKDSKIVHDLKGNPIRHKGARFVDFDANATFTTDDPELIAALRKHSKMGIDYWEDKGMKAVGAAAFDGYKVPYNALKAMSKSELLDVATRIPGFNLVGENGEGETAASLTAKIAKAFGYNETGEANNVKTEPKKNKGKQVVSKVEEEEEEVEEDEEEALETDADGEEDEEEVEDEEIEEQGTEDELEGDEEEEAAEEEEEVEEEEVAEEEEEEVVLPKKKKKKNK